MMPSPRRCWIFENAPALGVDAGRIAVGGDSAGGLLTACLTQAMKEKGGPAIAFQMLLFPATDLAGHFASMDKFGVGYFLDRQTIEWNNNQIIPQDADQTLAQNLTFAGEEFRGPAACLHHAGGL